MQSRGFGSEFRFSETSGGAAATGSDPFGGADDDDVSLLENWRSRGATTSILSEGKEGVFAKKIAENESRPEGLPPSQGGKYVGFGSSPNIDKNIEDQSNYFI
ncbi:hypothetical protein L1987_81660 [Smallanthus sonchifolius]|uniref:Uncharacterized protein n=1 Tax=Smallanthus sonchifolius TaxID=185202 RepID=A0ACB8YVB5_9ASTR|nr:hypothetical protein L1987_81660 [Smallanthus sonchifolius]